MKRNKAATQHETTASTITLCPSSFGDKNGKLTTSKVVKLRSPALNPKGRSATIPNKQEITSVLPTSATLFHELFHLVLGNDDTQVDGDEIYLLDKILELPFDEALSNPETFTLVAIAYDYTLQSKPDKEGWRVEFYSGFTTQG